MHSLGAFIDTVYGIGVSDGYGFCDALECATEVFLAAFGLCKCKRHSEEMRRRMRETGDRREERIEKDWGILGTVYESFDIFDYEELDSRDSGNLTKCEILEK